MAAPVGTKDPDVALAEIGRRLFNEPFTFDFFQAVRLLERLQPDREPVGRYAHPSTEAVRFGAHSTLNFPASQIHTLTARPDAAPAMEVNFLGLVGPSGVMPNYLTELIEGRIRAHDTALLDFLDIFNHRLTSFFYQAWEKHHFTIGYERDRSDPVTSYLFALAGFGTPGLRHRQPVRDESFLFYSGLYDLAPRSSTALESMLIDYFGVSVEVEPFIGTWRKLEEQDQCVFGAGLSESSMLGLGVVVGHEVWDQQSRVRIKIGPLDGEEYRRFLPSGAAWPELCSIAKTFSGNDLEFEVQLILKREDVPACELNGPAGDGPQLGWGTWMKSKPFFDRDADDTILLMLESAQDPAASG